MKIFDGTNTITTVIGENDRAGAGQQKLGARTKVLKTLDI
jgi:hypothetical protein